MNNIAQVTLWLGLIAIIISSLSYLLLCYRKTKLNFQQIARLSYISFVVFATLASALLMFFFLAHDFRFEYVINYSSADLPLHFLISSFWAGQEGSFLLWVLLSAWLGVILMRKIRTAEPQVMVLYNLQNIFLSILLIKQSPFKTVPVPYPDGMGLNMLLQDFWMVIHPPIVFLGYVAFTIPFALAMASLWRREYNEWVKQALPWVAFAFVTLGAGIIIGGVWSYKVLGWGGYWGWDPVENASLLPWLVGIALLHGMLLQNYSGRLAKTNYFLAAFAFILIIYSTFLTRSGVLADFSVHSFQDLGITAWLVLFIMIFVVITAYFLVTRSKEMPLPQHLKNKETPWFSLEYGLIGAVILLCLSAVFTGLGTSAPLITRILEKTSKVSNQFYINVNLPLAILMALLLSFVPLLKLGKNNLRKLLPKLITGTVTAVITAIGTLLNGNPGIMILFFVIVSGFAAGVSLQLVYNSIRKSIAAAAPALTHVGLGLMFIGFVVSSVYDESQRVALSKGESKNVFGYDIKFIQANISQEALGSRLYLPLELKRGQKVIKGTPDIYLEKAEHGEGKRFHHPFIQRGLWSDLYISPEGYEGAADSTSAGKVMTLKKGETLAFQDYQITFVKFDVAGMGEHQGAVKVAAELLVSYRHGAPMELRPLYAVGASDNSESRVKLPGEVDAFLNLMRIDATNKTIELLYDGPQTETPLATETLFAEVSIKPGMSLLWIGVTLLIVGGMLSIYRRRFMK